MPVKIKHDVRFHSAEQAMIVAHSVVVAVYQELGVECRLTCGIEEHEPPSHHVIGGAFDYGIRNTSEQTQSMLLRLIQVRLGPAFYAGLHPRINPHHIHTEYDPKD